MKCYFQLDRSEEWIKGTISSFAAGRRFAASWRDGEWKLHEIILFNPEILFYDEVVSVTGYRAVEGLQSKGDPVYELYNVTAIFTKPRAKT